MHIPKQLSQKKWDAKSKKIFLVGYESPVKNFRLYDPQTHKVIISCDVTFNESRDCQITDYQRGNKKITRVFLNLNNSDNTYDLQNNTRHLQDEGVPQNQLRAEIADGVIHQQNRVEDREDPHGRQKLWGLDEQQDQAEHIVEDLINFNDDDERPLELKENLQRNRYNFRRDIETCSRYDAEMECFAVIMGLNTYNEATNSNDAKEWKRLF